MALYKLSTTIEAVNGGRTEVFLIGKTVLYARGADGKPTDTIEGVRLDTLLPSGHMAPLPIRFAKDPLPKISDEDLAAACANLQPLILRVSGADVKIYSNPNGGMGLTATAEAAEIID